jgi:hypothetical protein
MIRVEADKSKNVLRFIFSHRVTVADMKKSFEDAKARIAELQSGFTLLSDLTDLEIMDPKCAADIERVMDLCRKAGVARAVRIIPDPRKDIGLSIMSLFHYGRKVRIATCETREEADKILAE